MTSTLGKLFESAGQVLIVVVLASSFGARDYGTFALALTLVTALSSSLSVGAPTLAARFLPSVDPAWRPAMARRLIGRLGRWRMLQAAGAASVAATLVLLDPGDFPTVISALVVLALTLDLAATLLFQVGLGLGRVTLFSFRFAVQNAAVVAAGVLLYTAWGIEGAVAAIAFSAALVLAWGAVTVGRPLARRPGSAGEEAAIPPLVWRFGAQQAVGGLLLTLLYRGGIVATPLLGASRAETGFAALAVGVGVSGTYVVGQAFAVNLPRLAEKAQAGAAAIELESVAFTRRALGVTVSAAILIALVVEPALPAIFGSSFSGAKDAVYIGLGDIATGSSERADVPGRRTSDCRAPTRGLARGGRRRVHRPDGARCAALGRAGHKRRPAGRYGVDADRFGRRGPGSGFAPDGCRGCRVGGGDPDRTEQLNVAATLAGVGLLGPTVLLVPVLLRIRGVSLRALAGLLCAQAEIVLVLIGLSFVHGLTVGGILGAELAVCPSYHRAVGAQRAAQPRFGEPLHRADLRGAAAGHPAVAILVFGAIGALGFQLFMGVAVAPNEYDSLLYHLPRAAHWVQQHSVLQASARCADDPRVVVPAKRRAARRLDDGPQPRAIGFVALVQALAVLGLGAVIFAGARLLG